MPPIVDNRAENVARIGDEGVNGLWATETCAWIGTPPPRRYVGYPRGAGGDVDNSSPHLVAVKSPDLRGFSPVIPISPTPTITLIF